MNQDFEKKLTERNIKPTAMRLLVLNEIAKSKNAVNFYDIEQKFDKAERSTIYRTLKIFEENNLVHSINDGSGSVKYALCNEKCTCKPEDLHVHFLCLKCGITFCLNDIPIPEVLLPENLIQETANYVIKGTCSECSNKIATLSH